MYWISLRRNISNLFELVDPREDLVKYIAENNNLSILPRVLPSLLNAGFLLLFGSASYISQDLKLVRTVECDDVLSFFRTEFRYCDVPELWFGRDFRAMVFIL